MLFGFLENPSSSLVMARCLLETAVIALAAAAASTSKNKILPPKRLHNSKKNA